MIFKTEKNDMQNEQKALNKVGQSIISMSGMNTEAPCSFWNSFWVFFGSFYIFKILILKS